MDFRKRPLILSLVSLWCGWLGAAEPVAEKKLPLHTVAVGAHHFTLPEGFTIELAAAPPLVQRPITGSFDEQGRLYVADSSGSNEPIVKQIAQPTHRILRLEDTNHDGQFDQTVVFADKLMLPEGTLWYEGSLYVAAPPSIWKLTDTDGDGVADQRIEWFKGGTATGCANDLHGPSLGPDGWIYWCKGAFATQTYQRPGRTPFITRASHIFRCRPDAPIDPATGSVSTAAIEPVMTGGMDNPVDVVFTAAGEPIFTTTFLVHPGGGQRDGLLHGIYGGVHGKPWEVIEDAIHPRTGDVLPVLAHLGAAAPCGLERCDSAHWGADFEGNLFASCFNMRKVTRHRLHPAASGFRSETSDFVVSDQVDFHPTDLLFDADGSLLILDTGGWYKLCCPTSQLAKPDVFGAIYRVRPTNATPVADPYGHKIAWSQQSDADLVESLNDARPFVRERAARALATHSAPLDFPPLTRTSEHRRRIVWALTRIDQPFARESVRAALSDDNPVVVQSALKSIGLWRDRAAIPQLARLARSLDPLTRRLAAEGLGRLGDAAAVPLLLELAATTTDDRFLEHAVIYALIEISQPAATREGLQSAAPGTIRAALIALSQMDGGGLEAPQIVPFLTSPSPLIRETAEWIVSRHADWGETLASVLAQQLHKIDSLTPGPETEVIAQRLTRSLTQFATTPAIESLLAESIARDVPTGLTRSQRISLEVMHQSVRKTLPERWDPLLQKRITDSAAIPLIVAIVRRSPPPASSTTAWTNLLQHVGHDARHEPIIRLSALAAVPAGLSTIDEPLWEFLRSQLPTEIPVIPRGMAAEILGRAHLAPEQMRRLPAALAIIGPLEIDRLLTAFDTVADDETGLQLVTALEKAPALAAVRPDALRRHLGKFGPPVQAAAQRIFASLEVDRAAQQEQLEATLAALPTGDPRQGQLIFQNQKTACSACHAIGYLGGRIGPDLSRIGQIRTNRDLLESILFPSASFVRSFEPTAIQLTDGRTLNGMIRRETDTELVLQLTADQEARVDKSEIEQQRPSRISIMPAGLDKQLTLQQIADLIAFLKIAQ